MASIRKTTSVELSLSTVCLFAFSRLLVYLASRSEIGKQKLKRPTTAVSLSNLARFRIRRYFEEK